MKETTKIEERFELEWLDRSVYTVRFPCDSDSKGTVLILHGLGDHIGRYDWAVRMFQQEGFDVLGIDWPGCGQSSGIRGDLPLLEDAAPMIEEILTQLEIKPVGALSHSAGSFFLIQFLAQGLPSLAGLQWVWFSSPLLDPSHRQNPLKIVAAKVLAKVIPKFTFSTGVVPRDCFHTEGDPVKRKFAEGVHNRVSVRFGRDILDPAKNALRAAPKISEEIAVMVTQGSSDLVCSPAIAEKFAARLKGPETVFLYAKGARHEPFREPEDLPFLNQVRAWLRR